MIKVKQPFKIGDLVKCIDNREAAYRLVQGDIYKVIAVSEGFEGAPMIRLIDKNGTASTMYVWRFTKVSTRNLPAWF